jgi:hypothetical protein
MGGFVLDTGSSTREAADMALAGRIAEVLERRYPGHAWAVHVDSSQGIGTVKNLRLSDRFGFVLKLRELLYEQDIAREARSAGGELLERFGLSRGRFRQSEYDALPATRLGALLFDAA